MLWPDTQRPPSQFSLGLVTVITPQSPQCIFSLQQAVSHLGHLHFSICDIICVSLFLAAAAWTLESLSLRFPTRIPTSLERPTHLWHTSLPVLVAQLSLLIESHPPTWREESLHEGGIHFSSCCTQHTAHPPQRRPFKSWESEVCLMGDYTASLGLCPDPTSRQPTWNESPLTSATKPKPVMLLIFCFFEHSQMLFLYQKEVRSFDNFLRSLSAFMLSVFLPLQSNCRLWDSFFFRDGKSPLKSGPDGNT